MFISLKPLDERKVGADEIIRRLRRQLATVEGASLFLQATQDLRVGGRGGNAQYQYTIQSENLDDLVKWGPLLLDQLRKVPAVTDVSSDQQNSGLQASLVYDRATASRLGLTPEMMDATLYDAFGQRQVSTMYTQLNQYLSQTLFDKGRRAAATEAARAHYDSTVANYRQTVLTSFQEVEDNLAALRILSRELDEQKAAVASAQRALTLSTERYKDGIDSYLNVITAQTALLNNQRTAVSLQMQQMTASVELIKALGGGWNANQLPTQKQLSHK